MSAEFPSPHGDVVRPPNYVRIGKDLEESPSPGGDVLCLKIVV